MDQQALRSLLDQLSDETIDLGTLCNKAPACACEHASSSADGHGPVVGDEVLRLFLCSPSEQEWPKKPDSIRTKMKSRAVKPGSFRRAFKSGLSVVRAGRATAEEFDLAARIQFENMQKKNSHSGGIYAVFEFVAADARSALGDYGMCVYETPLDPREDGTFARPSHSDVAVSKLPPDDVERNRLERVLYDYLMDSGRALNIDAETIDNGALRKYLPAAVAGVLDEPTA
jgi:hypothetical protein